MSEVMNVPEGWELRQSSELCDGIADGTHDTPKPSYFGFKLVTSKNLKNNELNFEDSYLISEEDYNSINKRSQVKQFDILFGMIGTIGNPVIIKDSKINFAIKNVGLFRFAGDYELSKWFYYYLESEEFKNYLDFILSGSSQKFVSLGMLRTLPILIPMDKEERNKINKILSTLDVAIESTQKLIEKEKNIKKGLISDLLTNGIDENGTIRTPQTHKYQQSELGMIPVEWEVHSLCKIAKIGSSKRIFESEYLSAGMPFYRSKEIILKAKNKSINTEIFISKSKFMDIKKTYKVPVEGDILITAVGTIGICYLVKNEEFYFKDGNLLWISNIKILSSFLIKLLNSNQIQNEINFISGGSSQSALTIQKLSQLNLVYPSSTEEQKQIAKILTTQDKKIETEQQNLAKLKELKIGLMGDLLGGDVRVVV